MNYLWVSTRYPIAQPLLQSMQIFQPPYIICWWKYSYAAFSNFKLKYFILGEKSQVISHYVKSQKKSKLPLDALSHHLYPLPSGSSLTKFIYSPLVCITTRKQQATTETLSATKPISSQIKPFNWTQRHLQMK